MTLFALLYGAQLALAGLGLWMVFGAARSLYLRAAVDAPVLISTVGRLLSEGRLEDARRLAAGLAPVPHAELLRAGLASDTAPGEASAAVAERFEDLQARLGRFIGTLHALARIAPPLAFGVAIAVMAGGLGGDAGLLALQRGLAESVALSRAMLSVVTGMTTALVSRAAADMLSRRWRSLMAELTDTAALFAGARLEASEER